MLNELLLNVLSTAVKKVKQGERKRERVRERKEGKIDRKYGTE